MRLLLISAAVVLITGMVLFMTRLWGLGQAYQAFSHPFLEAPKPWVAVQVADVSTAKKLQIRNKDVIFWLNLVMTSDLQFLIVDSLKPLSISRDLFKDQFRGPKAHFYDLKTLRLYFPEPILLEDFLKELPDARKILVLNENATDIHEAIIKVVETHKAESKVMFQSDAQIILQSIKEKKPLWLFGTTRSDSMRLLSFDSIGLVSASPYYGDVFISPFTISDRPAFNESVLNEVKRRKKNIMIGPIRTMEEIEQAKQLHPDGYIYETPDLLSAELGQDLAQ